MQKVRRKRQNDAGAERCRNKLVCFYIRGEQVKPRQGNDIGAERCRNMLACFYFRGEPVMCLHNDKQG